MKKTAKGPSDAETQPRYKRVTDSKSPTGRTELGFKSSKISEHKSVEITSPRQPDTSGDIKAREQAERSIPVQSKTLAVRHEYGHEQKIGQIARSRSKQKKDRLTLNLAKLTRKNKPAGKEEKMPDSIYMEKQQPLEERLPSEQSEEIYRQGWDSTDSKYQYLAPESQSDNRRSMFSQEIESVISHGAVEKGKETAQRIELAQNYIQPQLKNSSSAKNIALRVNEGQSRMIDASRISNSRAPSEKTEIYRGQQEMIEELLGKMNREKDDLHQLIQKLQGEKSRLQQANKQLIEAQFNMKNEIELLKMKNLELAKDQQNARYLASEQGLQHQRFRQGFENAFKQTEAQLIKANDQLQVKIIEINQLHMKIRQAQNRSYALDNEVRLLHTKNDLLIKEIEKQEKVHEAEMQEIVNRYEFMLKERDIKDQGPQLELAKLRQIVIQLQSQIVAQKLELTAKDDHIREIGHSVQRTQQQRIGNEVRLRQDEIENLLVQLNYTQNQLGKLNYQYSEKTKMYELELRKKDKQIAELRKTMQGATQQTNSNFIDKKAFEEMYGLQSETSQSTKAFLEMKQKQTEEMNALRDEVATSNQAIFNALNENSELKDRLRRMQQDNQMVNRTLNTNLNNLKQAKEASEKMLRVEIQSLNRKLVSFQTRLGLKDRQIKEKNKFIQQHLLNSTNGRPDAAELISKLEVLMNERD